MKWLQLKDLLLGYVMDAEATVSDTALSELVPWFRSGQQGMQLNCDFVKGSVEQMLNILEASPLASSLERTPDNGIELHIPKNLQQKQVSLKEATADWAE